MARALEMGDTVTARSVFSIIRMPEEKSSIARIKYNVLREILMDKFFANDAINALENAFRKELSK